MNTVDISTSTKRLRPFLRRKLVALSAVAVLALASVTAVFAYPNSAYVYPSVSGCTTTARAYAYLGGGLEQLYVWHQDIPGCATYVNAQAKILVGGQIVETNWDQDPDYADGSLAAGDYTFGYGKAYNQVGSSTSSTLTTDSVHP